MYPHRLPTIAVAPKVTAMKVNSQRRSIAQEMNCVIINCRYECPLTYQSVAVA
jgi:hypothetical protein